MPTLYELFDLSAGWRLPIRVTWLNIANAEVMLPEIPLLKIQRAAMEARLSEVAAHRHPDGSKWYITVRRFHEIAVQSKKTDPEDVVLWAPPEPETAVHADFIHAYCASPIRVVHDPEKFAILWASICKFILHRLIDQGKPVDLMFGRLDAFPVRANWKNVLVWTIYKKKDRAITRDAADYMLTKIRDWRLTAYDERAGVMRWTCEFTPGKEFQRAAEDHERRRKSNPRRTMNYLGQILGNYENQRERMLEIFLAWKKETAYPMAIFPGGCHGDAPPQGWHAVKVKATSIWYQVPAVTRAILVDETPDHLREGSVVVSEDASLPAMPNLQQGTEDVRDAGPPVDTAGEDSAGAERLRLLDAVEGADGRELLETRGVAGTEQDGLAASSELVPDQTGEDKTAGSEAGSSPQ